MAGRPLRSCPTRLNPAPSIPAPPTSWVCRPCSPGLSMPQPPPGRWRLSLVGRGAGGGDGAAAVGDPAGAAGAARE